MSNATKIAIATALFAATMPMSASRASGYDYIYLYAFYSDAAMTQYVGSDRDICYESGGNVYVITPQFPTAYYTATPIHECRPGGPQ